MQSLNQLYENYGEYGGSTILGQFGTSFFFRNNEPAIAKMVSSMCGMETVMRHQKNTSFGANEFRDGVSYNEHKERKNLVEYSDLANLAIGECFVLLPVPEARLAKIKVPEIKKKDRQDGFIQKKTSRQEKIEIISDQTVEAEDETITAKNITQLDEVKNTKL